MIDRARLNHGGPHAVQGDVAHMDAPHPVDALLYVDRLRHQLQRSAGFARGALDRALETFGPELAKGLETMLENLYPDEESLALAVGGYARFSLESMRRQQRFEAEGRYPDRTYAEAAAEVYHNDAYMRTQYLPGLLLSHYLWPHHYQQLLYFRKYICDQPRAAPWTFAEVAVGTGIYSRSLLASCPEAQGLGVDISATALEFCQYHVAAYGCDSRYRTECRDIIHAPLEQVFDLVVCVELLEHLENPVTMLQALRKILRPGGKLFVTAALNAAHADHIYLYREPQEVMQQLAHAELELEHMFYARAYAPREPGTPVPAVLAAVATPRR